MATPYRRWEILLASAEGRTYRFWAIFLKIYQLYMWRSRKFFWGTIPHFFSPKWAVFPAGVPICSLFQNDGQNLRMARRRAVVMIILPVTLNIKTTALLSAILRCHFEKVTKLAPPAEKNYGIVPQKICGPSTYTKCVFCNKKTLVQIGQL